MRKIGLLVSILYIISLTACKSLPPVMPKANRGAAIGISVELNPPLFSVRGLFNKKAEKVYFIRISENGKLSDADSLIPSTWVRGNRAYLLNPKPGRYFAVGAFYKVKVQETSSSQTSGNITVTTTTGGTVGYTTIFPENLIKLTEVNVRPSTLHFAGKYVIKMSHDIKNSQPIQKHFLEVMEPGSTTRTGLGALFSTLYVGIEKESTGYRSQEYRQPFIDKAREDFKGTNWVNLTNLE